MNKGSKIKTKNTFLSTKPKSISSKHMDLDPMPNPSKNSKKKIKKRFKSSANLQVPPSHIPGIKELDTGLALPAQWNLAQDAKAAKEQPLQVARCNKIIPDNKESKYVIHIKQMAKFVVKLSDKLAPSDVEEGMRVGVDRQKYMIQMPLPPKIDATVTMMTVEEKPDVTYADIGGCKEQLEKLR